MARSGGALASVGASQLATLSALKRGAEYSIGAAACSQGIICWPKNISRHETAIDARILITVFCGPLEPRSRRSRNAGSKQKLLQTGSRDSRRGHQVSSRDVKRSRRSSRQCFASAEVGLTGAETAPAQQEQLEGAATGDQTFTLTKQQIDQVSLG